MPVAYRIIYGFILKLKVLYAKKLNSDKQKIRSFIVKNEFRIFLFAEFGFDFICRAERLCFTNCQNRNVNLMPI